MRLKVLWQRLAERIPVFVPPGETRRENLIPVDSQSSVGECTGQWGEEIRRSFRRCFWKVGNVLSPFARNGVDHPTSYTLFWSHEICTIHCISGRLSIAGPGVLLLWLV